MPQEPRPIPPLRTVAFLVVAAWITLSPGLVQVLGLKTPWIRTWRMYGTKGHDTCDVRYYARGPDGADTPIDRIAVLHKRPWWALSPPARRVSRDDLLPMATRICRRAALTDVRAVATCADARAGWVPVLDRERNLCPGGS